MSITLSRPDVLDAVATDHLPSRVDDRAAIREAVAAVASDYGQVHIALVRDYLRRDVEPHQLGATITALVRSGHLVWTGEIAPNGNTETRNALRPAKVYALTRPMEDLP